VVWPKPTAVLFAEYPELPEVMFGSSAVHNQNAVIVTVRQIHRAKCVHATPSGTKFVGWWTNGQDPPLRRCPLAICSPVANTGDIYVADSVHGDAIGRVHVSIGDEHRTVVPPAAT